MAQRHPHPGQLDVFRDSDAVAFANDVIESLCRRDASRAAACLRRLSAEDPAYGSLNELQTLCRALGEWPLPSSVPAEIAVAVRRLETEVQPAARRALGGEAPDFLRRLWRDLAQAARPHPYEADHPEAFCAGLYLRCGESRAAAEAAESIPNGDGNPDALYWLSVARYGTGGLHACRSSLLRLALLAPERLSAAITEIGDPALLRDWKAFRSACAWIDPAEETSAVWFPAWYLTQHPGVPGTRDGDSLPVTPGTAAYVLIGRLNALEKSGYSTELIAARSRLRDLAPELFALHMARHERRTSGV